MSVEVPDGWESASLGSMLVLQYGTSLTKATRRNGSVPVYGSAGIVDFHDAPCVKNQSIVIGRKGSVGTVYLTDGPFWPIDTTYYVEPKGELDWIWLKELLIHLDLKSLNEATGVPGLNRDRAYSLDIAIPPLPEQQRIAEILSSVDESIRATEAVISQAERVKRGLMEDLLTGGLGSAAIANGEVPEGWSQSQVGDHVELLSGFPFKSADYSDNLDDVRLLRGDNIGQGHLRWRNAKRWDRNQYWAFEKYHLAEGDFVIAMDRTWVSGGLKVAEVGRHDLPSLLLQRVSRLRAKETLDQRLLRYFINSHHFEQYVKSVQTETAVPHISAKQIKEFPILIPPIVHQQRIAETLSCADDQIISNRATVEQLQRLKRGLMDDLLTGKVRTVA